ncbi:Oidioi.mRNA.OKI2018_I69.chr1.g139.t1.cds [Oikopleura dioica]|uniref:Oidioi.mRNA.OKI2018_I69.chr1.g139.t1.cds n=1 Tax=Oikopleura dioica TaxID=34765 RepID=A0ABN7SMS1_OIKDI|nr:Oidioi.mRNA.OKI2018_I69.chr1.g139.t1.cds [Oikopleura dioica]
MGRKTNVKYRFYQTKLCFQPYPRNIHSKRNLRKSLKNADDLYIEELAFSKSNTIIDIYERLDNLTLTFERVFTTIEAVDQKIEALEVKMENMVFQPKPTPPPINYAYSRMLVMSADEPNSSSDMINLKTLSNVNFQISFPKLQWHCLENYYGNVYSIGGRHTEYEIYELDGSCRFQRMDITLPKGFINHQCALHDNVMYACPDWSRGDSCIGIKRDSSALTRCTQTVLKAFGKFGERLWQKSFVCSKQSDNTRQCKPNSYRKFQNAKIKSQSSVLQLLTWCEKKTPETTAICDLQTMQDAKERLIRENFKSELTNIKRIKTIYDKPTVVIEGKNAEKSEIPAGVINANRTFDKRLRLLEAKLDHLSRQIGRLSK